MLSFQTWGAQVLRASSLGAELLYFSPLSCSPERPARGGIPVLFPQFADRGPLKKHGWARDLPWGLLCDELGSNQHIVELDLCIDEGTQHQWPHGALLRLQVQAFEQALCMTFQVHNTGATPFEWTGGLHPYWATSDLLATEVTGLQATPLQWTGEAFEHLFDTQAPLTLKTPGHALKLSMTGFDQWMVWNPGATGAQAQSDLPNEDWQKIVCIEPVLVDRPCVLQPGAVFEGTLRAELI